MIYYLLIILILIYIYYFINYDIKHNIIKHNNILNNIILEQFKIYNFINNGIYSNIEVDIYEYKNNSLKIINNYKSTINNFINTKTKNLSQAVIKLDNNIYFKYILNIIKNDLSKYYNINELKGFKLRISKTPWSYPAHFDCIDGKLLQLYNKRIINTVKFKDIQKFNNLDKKKPNYINKFNTSKSTILLPGDLIEIPMYLIHSVEGYSLDNNNISIALSFNTNTINTTCNKIFEDKFKYRNDELINGYL
tara:strand:+ start:10392 stop:11141 length:750 start_codon:yes stop_codon:yes gene_type:complete